MTISRHKAELLAPAGNFEKLETAVHYGADAVYLGGKTFSLRNFSDNFSLEEIDAAVHLARQNQVKVYVACNIYSRNFEQKEVGAYLRDIADIGVDAVIVADPGIVLQARKLAANMPIHLSTQANTTNINSVRFWESVGVRRINLARELSLAEIKSICSQTRMEIETFIHGAMCISYSGRCLLSSFLTNRDSNRGECTHPCRWRYAVVEETRPGSYMPVAEDDRGTYIFNAKDLCMVAHIPTLVEAGINSFKIEGRMKGIHYLATTVNVYRQAIDAYYQQPKRYALEPSWFEELDKVNQRGYCTGFYFEDESQGVPDYRKQKRSLAVKLIAKVTDRIDGQKCRVDVRNKILKGDQVEILSRQNQPLKDQILDIIDADGNHTKVAQPGSRVILAMRHSYHPYDLIRQIMFPNHEQVNTAAQHGFTQ